MDEENHSLRQALADAVEPDADGRFGPLGVGVYLRRVKGRIVNGLSVVRANASIAGSAVWRIEPARGDRGDRGDA